MAENILSPTELLNKTGFSELLFRALPTELTAGLGFLINVGKVIGVLVIIYLGFLIVQAVIKIRQALRIKALAENVSEINKKLDTLISKFDKKTKEEKKEEKKEVKKK